jgi:chromosome segregation ATPase
VPSDPSDRRVVDFAQLRVTMPSDALRELGDHIKATNTHVARLTRDVGELQADMRRLEKRMDQRFSQLEDRFDRLARDVKELVGEQVLQANQILDVQQDSRRALMRIEEILEDRAAGPAAKE